MPARTGQEYLTGLQEQDREVWLRGERVKNVTTHPGLANGARAVAALYDMQHDPDLRDEMTYVSPTSGGRVGLPGSAFGSRQVLYERFFASDPLTRTRILNTLYPKAEVMERVVDFLRRSDDAP